MPETATFQRFLAKPIDATDPRCAVLTISVVDGEQIVDIPWKSEGDFSSHEIQEIGLAAGWVARTFAAVGTRLSCGWDVNLVPDADESVTL